MEHIIEADISGTGTLTLGDLATPAAHHNVRYNLDRYRVIPTGMIAGSHEEVRGRIAPVYFTSLAGVTLQLQDGRRINVTVNDTAGTVISAGGFEIPGR